MIIKSLNKQKKNLKIKIKIINEESLVFGSIDSLDFNKNKNYFYFYLKIIECYNVAVLQSTNLQNVGFFKKQNNLRP